MNLYINNLKANGVRQVLVDQKLLESSWLRNVRIYIEDGVILSRQSYGRRSSPYEPVVCTHLDYKGDNEQVKAFLNPDRDNSLTYLETEYNEEQVAAAKLLLPAINASFGVMTPRTPTLDNVLSRIVAGFIYESVNLSGVGNTYIKSVKKQLANFTDSQDFISKADVKAKETYDSDSLLDAFSKLRRPIPFKFLVYKDESGRWRKEDNPPEELSHFSNLEEVLDLVGYDNTPVYSVECSIPSRDYEGIENFKVRRVTK